MIAFIDTENGTIDSDGLKIQIDTTALSQYRAIAILDDGQIKAERLSGETATKESIEAIRSIIDALLAERSKKLAELEALQQAEPAIEPAQVGLVFNLDRSETRGYIETQIEDKTTLVELLVSIVEAINLLRGE